MLVAVTGTQRVLGAFVGPMLDLALVAIFTVKGLEGKCVVGPGCSVQPRLAPPITLYSALSCASRYLLHQALRRELSSPLLPASRSLCSEPV